MLFFFKVKSSTWGGIQGKFQDDYQYTLMLDVVEILDRYAVRLGIKATVVSAEVDVVQPRDNRRVTFYVDCTQPELSALQMKLITLKNSMQFREEIILEKAIDYEDAI